jgi:hypothetical protein
LWHCDELDPTEGDSEAAEGFNLLSKLSRRLWDTFRFWAAFEPGSGVLGELEYDDGELAEASEA